MYIFPVFVTECILFIHAEINFSDSCAKDIKCKRYVKF